jgi:hypothetical protein
VGIRRTITAVVSVSALVLISVPVVAAGAVPLSVRTGTHWYEGKSGTVRWAVGDEFLQQLTDAGATLSFCSAAKLSVISGVNVATMPARGNSIILLGSRSGDVDGATDCTITISGNGTEVELTTLYFNVSTSSSGMSASINGDFTGIATGPGKKMPKLATRGKIAVISPPLTTEPALAAILRGEQNSDGTFSGPVPTMTDEGMNLGLFQLQLKVKATSRPQNPDNSEG